MNLKYSFVHVLLLSFFLSGASFGQSLKVPKAPKTPKAPQVEAPVPPEPPTPPAPPEISEEIFKIVEDMPRFPGCEDMEVTKQEVKECAQQKLTDYIASHLKYPEEARKSGITGTVVVQFVVTEQGSVEDLALLRDIGGGCGDAGIDVFDQMGEDAIVWIPGKQRGKAVSVQLTIPIKFAL